MSQLPLDVLVAILDLVPPVRDRRETSVLILLNCLQVNSLFYEAASLPFLWKAHYHIRYEHCVEELERTRSKELDYNWRLMYARRRQMDRDALNLLDKMVSTTVNMQEIATSLVRKSLDIWDMLELECNWPIPEPFGNCVVEDFVKSRKPGGTICCRFWAGYVRDTIARASGVSLWRKFIASAGSSTSDWPSFELTMSSISTVFGVSYNTITRQLDSLANLCRQYLLGRGIFLAYREPAYDLPTICKEICSFMQVQGFSRYIHSPWAGNNSWDIVNKFPHVYLTTNKATIPISLVHIFVAIATRLDIDASPINFPRVVLCYVRPRGKAGQPIIVNPSAIDANNSVIVSDTPYIDNPIQQAQMFNLTNTEHAPSDAATMLLRAANNISATLPRYATQTDAHASALLVLCVNLIFDAETLTLKDLLASADLRPLDCIFLQDELAPYLRPRCKQLLEGVCRAVLEDHATIASQITRRKTGVTIQFFVGMAFVHVQYGYTGVIVGWDETCKAADAWINHMGINKLSRGKEQPFYEVYAVDGTMRYVAEENIRPASFNKEHLQSLCRIFGQLPSIFEGADCPVDPSKGVDHRQGRGRLLLSAHRKEAFPDDSEYGAQWVEHGYPLRI